MSREITARNTSIKLVKKLKDAEGERKKMP